MSLRPLPSFVILFYTGLLSISTFASLFSEEVMKVDILCDASGAGCPERNFIGCVTRLRIQRVPFDKNMLNVVFNITSQAKLIHTCKAYSDVLPCFRDRIVDCGNEKQKRLLDEVAKMLMFFCSPFSMKRQDAFMKHGECIGQVLQLPASTSCHIENHRFNTHIQACRKNCFSKREFICMMKIWISEQSLCTLIDVGTKCGQEAADFFLELQTNVFEKKFPIICDLPDDFDPDTFDASAEFTFPPTVIPDKTDPFANFGGPINSQSNKNMYGPQIQPTKPQIDFDFFVSTTISTVAPTTKTTSTTTTLRTTTPIRRTTPRPYRPYEYVTVKPYSPFVLPAKSFISPIPYFPSRNAYKYSTPRSPTYFPPRNPYFPAFGKRTTTNSPPRIFITPTSRSKWYPKPVTTKYLGGYVGGYATPQPLPKLPPRDFDRKDPRNIVTVQVNPPIAAPYRPYRPYPRNPYFPKNYQNTSYVGNSGWAYGRGYQPDVGVPYGSDTGYGKQSPGALFPLSKLFKLATNRTFPEIVKNPIGYANEVTMLPFPTNFLGKHAYSTQNPQTKISSAQNKSQTRIISNNSVNPGLSVHPLPLDTMPWFMRQSRIGHFAHPRATPRKSASRRRQKPTHLEKIMVDYYKMSMPSSYAINCHQFSCKSLFYIMPIVLVWLTLLLLGD